MSNIFRETEQIIWPPSPTGSDAFDRLCWSLGNHNGPYTVLVPGQASKASSTECNADDVGKRSKCQDLPRHGYDETSTCTHRYTRFLYFFVPEIPRLTAPSVPENPNSTKSALDLLTISTTKHHKAGPHEACVLTRIKLDPQEVSEVVRTYGRRT